MTTRGMMSAQTDGGAAGQTGVLEANKPGVARLVEQLSRCGSVDPNQWDRLRDNERVRFNVWDGQTNDCKKHDTDDEPARPFDGASDLRVYLADAVISEQVDMLTSAFSRAFLRASGSQPKDAGLGAMMTQVLRWYARTKQGIELNREVQLSANYMETYGWCALQPLWQREITLRPRRVALDELVQALSIAGDDAIAEALVTALADPGRESEAAELLGTVYEAYLRAEFPDFDGSSRLPRPSKRRLRRVARELAERGEASVPVPTVTRNQPTIRALCPWRDVFIPNDLGDLSEGRAYVREFITEEELLSRQLTDDYDPRWVEQARKTRGMVTLWSGVEGWDTFSSPTTATDPENGLIEVWTAYTRRMDEDGVPGVYVTVFSGHFDSDQEGHEDLAARHGLIDYEHGQVPLVTMAREWPGRAMAAARGTPEVLWPLQRLVKVQLDALVDRTSLTTLPPMLMDPRDIDMGWTFAPLSGVPYRLGRQKPEPIALPRFDAAVPKVLEWVRDMVDDQYGRLSSKVAPTKSQFRQQRAVNNFLAGWQEAFQQEMALIIQYCPPDQWERITGQAKPEMTPSDVIGEYRLMLTLDVRELDLDQTTGQLKTVVESILPTDAAGTIDRAKLVRLALQSVNPTLAEELTVPQGEASQRLYEQVKQDIALMALGNPPTMVENDPTAGAKLQYAGQIIQANPTYQQALQQGGRFKELLDIYVQNLQQSVAQERNKMIGRIGVDPEQANLAGKGGETR